MSVNCHNKQRAVLRVQDGTTSLIAKIKLSKCKSLYKLNYELSKRNSELGEFQYGTHDDEDEGDPKERVRLYRQSNEAEEQKNYFGNRKSMHGFGAKKSNNICMIWYSLTELHEAAGRSANHQNKCGRLRGSATILAMR